MLSSSGHASGWGLASSAANHRPIRTQARHGGRSVSEFTVVDPAGLPDGEAGGNSTRSTAGRSSIPPMVVGTERPADTVTVGTAPALRSAPLTTPASDRETSSPRRALGPELGIVVEAREVNASAAMTSIARAGTANGSQRGRRGRNDGNDSETPVAERRFIPRLPEARGLPMVRARRPGWPTLAPLAPWSRRLE